MDFDIFVFDKLLVINIELSNFRTQGLSLPSYAIYWLVKSWSLISAKLTWPNPNRLTRTRRHHVFWTVLSRCLSWQWMAGGSVLVPPFLLEVASIWHKVSKWASERQRWNNSFLLNLQGSVQSMFLQSFIALASKLREFSNYLPILA